MIIELTPRFKKSFRKLPAHIQKKAVLKMRIFKINPFNSRLNTHKLHGDKKEEWSFSVDRSYRVSFIFLDYRAVLYTEIGVHDKVY